MRRDLVQDVFAIAKSVPNDSRTNIGQDENLDGFVPDPVDIVPALPADFLDHVAGKLPGCMNRRSVSLHRQILRVISDLTDGGNNFMHVLVVTEQRGLRNPYCLPGGSLRVRERMLEEGMVFLCLCAAQALPIFVIPKHG